MFEQKSYLVCLYSIYDHGVGEQMFKQNYFLVKQKNFMIFVLRILTGKKHPKIKLQHLKNIRIWTFESLVHQGNSF